MQSVVTAIYRYPCTFNFTRPNFDLLLGAIAHISPVLCPTLAHIMANTILDFANSLALALALFGVNYVII